MLNNVTTLGMPVVNTSQVIKIESKQIKSQYIPYFFTSINNSKVSTKNSKKIINNKNENVKK